MTTPSLSTLTAEQSVALDKILVWHADKSPDNHFFVLSGSAGTGKTYCVRDLPKLLRGQIIYTAPTNKATKVLRDTLTTKEYKPDCRTIYSLLGLTLQPNGEVKTLSAPEDPVDLSSVRLVIVDEGSMVSSILWPHILTAAKMYNLKFLFMGDPAQLPPVKEASSPIWKIEARAHLSKVMRHDNQILTLVTVIREVVDLPFPRLKLAPDNADNMGVFYEPQTVWLDRILDAAEQGEFSRQNAAKAIAWRNATVDSLNRKIRQRIYPGAQAPWVEGDRVIFTAPAKDLDDKTIATTDDEGRVEDVQMIDHPTLGAEFPIFRVAITLDTNQLAVARVIHPSAQARYDSRVDRMAREAHADRRLWPKFWDFKDSFHSLRHAYAITAHRSQGSTYDSVYADWRDILCNPTKQEAYRCLYVACSRPKYQLFL